MEFLNIQSPILNDSFSDIYTNLRNIKRDISDRFGLEHFINSSQDTSTGIADGHHQYLSIQNLSNIPEFVQVNGFYALNDALYLRKNSINYLIANNGRSALRQPTPVLLTMPYGDYRVLKYLNGYFFYAVVKNYGNKNSKIYIYRSTDGINWSLKYNAYYSYAIYDMAYGDGTYVITTSGNSILYSKSNGSSWASIQPALDPFYYTSSVGVAYGDGYFVFGGKNGYIYRVDPDSLSVLDRIDISGYVLNSICFSGSTFFGCSASGSLYTSADGSSWNHSTSFSTYNFVRITYGDGGVVVAGNTDSGAICIRRYSGGSWDSISHSLPATTIYDLQYSDDGYYYLSGNNLLARSSNGTTWARLVDGNILIRRVAGKSGIISCISNIGVCFARRLALYGS